LWSAVAAAGRAAGERRALNRFPGSGVLQQPPTRCAPRPLWHENTVKRRLLAQTGSLSLALLGCRSCEGGRQALTHSLTHSLTPSHIIVLLSTRAISILHSLLCSSLSHHDGFPTTLAHELCAAAVSPVQQRQHQQQRRVCPSAGALPRHRGGYQEHQPESLEGQHVEQAGEWCSKCCVYVCMSAAYQWRKFCSENVKNP
jgi:hypothetical protein